MPMDTVKDYNGYTPFLKAAYYGRVKWMQRLIERFPGRKSLGTER